MASTLLIYSFSVILYLLCISSSFSYAAYDKKNPLDVTPCLLKQQAENLIRAFNLSPKKSVNIASSVDVPSVVSSKIVEKELNLHQFLNTGAARPSVQDFGHHAGYYKLPHTKGARMFYLFFESRKNKKDDPVVIWLTGGPGCSCELASFYENGPFQLTKNLSLKWNEYGWDQASNIIFVDQPTGTGFSYTTNDDDLRHDEKGVSNDLYDFLQAFFVEHPSMAKRDFYITGESYAGHYIPALASRVHQGNKAKEGTHINLKGFAIGNGLTDPAIQYKAYSDFALDMKLIKKSDYHGIQKMVPDCEQAIKQCGSKGGDACNSAFYVCTNIFGTILNDIAGNINVREILSMEAFLNKKSVKDALGVGDIDFVSCSTEVYDAMKMDWMKNLEVGIPSLLEDGIKVLIYAGEYDLICNWLGNSRWVHAMEWSGKKKFGAAKYVPFVVDGAEAGQMKSHGPLIFLKVHNAGHMVPMDQPKAALQMIKSWMHGKLVVPE
ncbi:hypothetical protein ACFE04_005185 [Oxalis oulophora]